MCHQEKVFQGLSGIIEVRLIVKIKSIKNNWHRRMAVLTDTIHHVKWDNYCFFQIGLHQAGDYHTNENQFFMFS